MPYIRKLKTDRFSAVVYLGIDPNTGKPNSETRSFGTKKEAESWAKSIEVKRDSGEYRPTLSSLTFADYLLERWLPVHKKRVRNAYPTECSIRKWICRPQPNTPFLGKLPLKRLTVSDFDRLYVAMEEKHGLNARGVRHLHSILRRALKFAVSKGELPRNPTDHATVPSATQGPIRSLTKEQESRLLAAARTRLNSAEGDDRDCFCALLYLLLDSGCRPGEAFACKWEADTMNPDAPRWGWIDLEKKMMYVRATMMRSGVKAESKKGWKLAPPKTENSRRDIPICEDTVAELKRWKKQQAAQQLKAGSEWQALGFVFTTRVGTPFGDNVRRAWNQVMRLADGGKGDLGAWKDAPKRKGLHGPQPDRPFTPRFSLYVTRHSMAVLGILDGMDLGLLSRRLGHASASFTFDRYGRGVRAEHTRAVADNTQRRWRGEATG